MKKHCSVTVGVKVQSGRPEYVLYARTCKVHRGAQWYGKEVKLRTTYKNNFMRHLTVVHFIIS